MWTKTTRGQYRRKSLRYAGDMTDAEWAMIEVVYGGGKRLGRPRKVALRAVVEGLLHVLRTACPWRLLPHDFPNRSTVQRYFYAWQADGLWERINFVLHQHVREQVGREASPSGGVIDSQSIETTAPGRAVTTRTRRSTRASVTSSTTPWAPGRRPAARRRHPGSQRRGRRAGFDPLPLPLAAPCLCDAGYAGEKLETTPTGMGQWTLAIVKRPDEPKGFCLLPRRWVVERTFPWFGGYRRLAKDIEVTIAGAYAGLYLASVQLLARRLALRKYH
jgi:transposase